MSLEKRTVYTMNELQSTKFMVQVKVKVNLWDDFKNN